MWLGKAFQGTVSSLFDQFHSKKLTFSSTVSQFPSDLLETTDSPNIYITSPSISTSRFQPPPLSMGMNIMHSLNSPNSSPTTSDFQGGGHYHHQQPHHAHHGHHQHHGHSRPHGFPSGNGGGNGYSRTGDSNSSTPLPSSPGSISMDLFDDGSCDLPPGRPSTKRQRMDDGGVNGINGGIGGLVGGGGGGSGGGPGNSSDAMTLLSSVSSPGAGSGINGLSTLTVPKKSSRARSDSAPLGYGGVGTAMHSWQQQQGEMSGGGNGRPRSGSGMVPHREMGGHAR